MKKADTLFHGMKAANTKLYSNWDTLVLISILPIESKSKSLRKQLGISLASYYVSLERIVNVQWPYTVGLTLECPDTDRVKTARRGIFVLTAPAGLD
jgi:hypothetical protein